MKPRLPRKKAPSERDQLVDVTDGLDLFALDPERSPSRIAPAKGAAGRGKHSSRIDGPLPVEDVTARSSMEEVPPELVWLDATDGLEDFAPIPDRHQATSSIDAPIPHAAVIAASAGTEVEAGLTSRFDWMKRAGRAALVGSVLAAAADGFLAIRPPATPQPAVVRPEPAIDAPEPGNPGGFGGRSALARVDATPRPAVKRARPVSPVVVVRTAARASASTDDRGGPRGGLARAQRSDALPVPRVETPGDVETRAENTTAGRGPGALSPASVETAMLAPGAANTAGASLPAVGISPAAGPVVEPPARAETARSASTNESLAAVATPPRRELEARAIENVLGRYRNAFNRLDAGAALAVWPTVNEKTLARAFERLADQDVSFESCQIEVVAVLAEAACSGSARYVPKVGSRTPRAEARQWRFSLRKASGGWLIDRVDAR